MSDSVIESLGIIKGHYECNFLDQTVPVLSELLALEVVARGNNEVTMKHPNTDWLLVVHESGPEVPDKPFRNHYGVRVTGAIQNTANGQSFLLCDLNKNWWEIECAVE